jgi:hypothetical protein
MTEAFPWDTAPRDRSLTDAPDALLMAIIGGPDAGKVDWHPSVLEEARKTGLTVDKDQHNCSRSPTRA